MPAGAMKRELNADDRAELKRLNEAINAAFTERTQWLDRKMVELCKFQPGDEMDRDEQMWLDQVLAR